MSGSDKMHLIHDGWGRARNIDIASETEPTETWPYMLWLKVSTATLKVRNLTNSAWVTVGTGGGGGAPIDAQYLLMAPNAELTHERVLAVGKGLDLADGGAGGAATLTVDADDLDGDGLQESGGDLAVDATVVRTSGAQSIAGGKTFTDDLTVDDARLITSRTAAIAAQHTVVDGTGNAVTEVLRLIHNLNVGYGAAGMGSRVLLRLVDDGGTIEDAAAIDAVWEAATDGSETAYLAFLLRVVGAALAEVGRLDATGLYLQASKTIDMDEQATPANPAGGRRKIYPKSDGWYDLDDGGAETGPFGTGGGGAPADAQYVVLALHGDLSNERKLTAGSGISVTDGGAGGNVTVAADATIARVSGVHARAYRDSGTLNVADSTWVTLTFTVEDYDTGADLNYSTGVFTAPANGYYLVAGHFNFDSAAWAAGKSAILTLYKDGSAESELNRIIVAAVTSEIGAGGSAVVYLTASETIYLRVYQNSGSTRVVKAARHSTWFAVSKLVP